MAHSRRTDFDLHCAVFLLTLSIALLMPITPSKTGSRWRPSEAILGEPSYILDMLVWFGVTNLLFGVLAFVVLVSSRRDSNEEEREQGKIDP